MIGSSVIALIVHWTSRLSVDIRRGVHVQKESD